MGIKIDLHLHTSRYSHDSKLPAEKLVAQAVRRGLDGVVITEHHHQWDEEELRELVEDSGAPGFVCLAGFEYTSAKGDLLIYGLTPDQAASFKPGAPPEDAAAKAADLGGVMIAAHATRQGLSFDERLLTLPLAAIEGYSTNMKPHDSRLAERLAKGANLPLIASSDAHRLGDVGRYFAEFDDVIREVADLQQALTNGRFRVGNGKG